MSKINTTVGFTGFGRIASALAKGLCSSKDFAGKIYVYNRHEEKTKELKKAYPDKIIVAGSNQEVLDKVEVVIPALVPEVLAAVAPTLKFRKNNRVAHLAAATKLATASPWYAPAQSVVRIVPLSFAERRYGPIVFFGSDPVIEEVLALVGTVIKVKTEKDLEVLAVVTGVMVPYYAVVSEIVKWCMSKGMDFRSAVDYTCCMNESLSVYMREVCTEDTNAFMLEMATPGGMNERAWNNLKKAGSLNAWTESLEQIGKLYGI